MKEGWICPKCGRVWAPHALECFDCNSYRNDPPGKDAPNKAIRVTLRPEDHVLKNPLPNWLAQRMQRIDNPGDDPYKVACDGGKS